MSTRSSFKTMSSLGHIIIIGAMKAGTTSLYRWLASFDSIASSRIKDTKYFLTKRQGGNYYKGYSWYAEQFRVSPSSTMMMESSSHYSKFPDYKGIPSRIRNSLIHPKLIYLVRNPIDRTLSHFFHNLVIDGTVSNINQSLSKFESKYYNYSDYAMQLNRYYLCFDSSSIFVADLFGRELKNSYMQSILDFLDVDTQQKQKPFSCLTKENSLELNIMKRKSGARDGFCGANQRSFKRMEEVLSTFPGCDLVNLAIEMGMQDDTFKYMIDRQMRMIERFESFNGRGYREWITKYECYL